MARKAVGYVRVSTEKQAEKGISLEAQQAKIEAYATLYDLEIVEVVIDAGASAKSLDREGLQRALGLLKSGKAEALVVIKLDRLTRSVVDLGELIRDYFAGDKWSLLSVNEHVDTKTASGRLVLQILGCVSAWERESAGERTRAALQHKASIGEYVGGEAPFGFRLSGDGKTLEANPEEQATIAEAKRLRGLGYSLQTVALALAGQGRFNRRRNAFAPMQISRMLKTEERTPPASAA